mgnify:CR=1 FL=1
MVCDRSQHQMRDIQRGCPVFPGNFRHHEIEQNEIERFRVDAKEGTLARALDDDLVVLPLEAFTQSVGDLQFIFDD